ncbi:TSUP family transporter [Marinobacterium arenosum]|uniref:TSUP family transporter n=1 Tax=Marinobacterium arenosum TaxID=2862496 RepID=UPI001C95FFAE|nr:TSUP family transporter [Marinobacterium arenosum]
MLDPTLIGFTAIIAFATYVQTVTGFALGMIVMGAVTTFELVPIAFTSVVISLVTIANGCFAIKGNMKALNLNTILITCAGIFPALALGLALLDYLSSEFSSLLQTLLGTTIICGGLMIMLKPEPIARPSGKPLFAASGAAAGLLAGMFSMAGPPLVYQFYRQPFEMQTIRLSLLAIFLICSVLRTGMVGVQGGLTLDMFTFTALALPVVALFTWLGRNYPPPLSPANLRRLAFGLLITIGISLLVGALRS